MTAKLLDEGKLGAKDAQFQFFERLTDTDVNVVVTSESQEELDRIVDGANFVTKFS